MGLMKKPWMGLGAPLKHEYRVSLRHAIAADIAIANRFAAQAEGRRVQAHALFGNLFGEFQPWGIGPGWGAAAQHLFPTGGGIFLSPPRVSPPKSGPRQRQHGSFVVAGKQRHTIVS